MSIPRDTSFRPPPIHPGEFLREDFMLPLGLDSAQLSEAINVPVVEIEAVLQELQSVSSDMAYRLAIYFGNSPEYWTSLQTAYELNSIYHQRLNEMVREVRPRVAA